MKVHCDTSDKCPRIFCPHAKIGGHEPILIDVETGALCTEPSECAMFALMVHGIGAKKSVQCVPVETEEKEIDQ